MKRSYFLKLKYNKNEDMSSHYYDLFHEEDRSERVKSDKKKKEEIL